MAAISLRADAGQAWRIEHPVHDGPIHLSILGRSADVLDFVHVQLDEDGWRQLVAIVDLYERERIVPDHERREPCDHCGQMVQLRFITSRVAVWAHSQDGETLCPNSTKRAAVAGKATVHNVQVPA